MKWVCCTGGKEFKRILIYSVALTFIASKTLYFRFIASVLKHEVRMGGIGKCLITVYKLKKHCVITKYES